MGWKAGLAIATPVLVLGICIGFIIAYAFMPQGCKLNVTLPGRVGIDCSSDLPQVRIDFGSHPSSRTLSDALRIVAEMTQARGDSRVLVDRRVLDASFGLEGVEPPAGPQPVLGVVRQLLASARASDKVDICFARQGSGYVLQLAGP